MTTPTAVLRPRRQALGLTAAGVIAAAVLLGGCGGSSGSSRRQAEPSPGANAPPGFTRFSDPGLGLSIAYPSSWVRLPPGDPQVPLLVGTPNHAEALIVRVTPLGLAVHKVTVAELPKLRPLSDRIIHADPRAHLVQKPGAVVLGGLPGFVYVYTGTGKLRGPGVGHVHYFLFSGPSLIQLVFQSAQASRLQQAARGDFRHIEATLKVGAAPVAVP